MGWKGALRSASAADKRYRRERDTQNRRVDRAIDKFERDGESLRKKARSLEEKAAKDILKTFSVRYSNRGGFEFETVTLSTDSYEVSVALSIEDEIVTSTRFEPAEFTNENAKITPLTIGISPYALLLAIRVDNNNEVPFRCNWVKKSDPQASRVFMIDSEHNEYFYPSSTNLTGDILAGHPREGILAFPTPRYAPTDLQIHFSDIGFTKKRSEKVSFSFRYTSDQLKDRVESAIESPSITTLVDDNVESQINDNTQQVNKHRIGETSPVAWAALILVLAFVLASLA